MKEVEEVEDEDKEEEQEEQEEPPEKRAQLPGGSIKRGSEVVRPKSQSPGSRSEPGSPRARLRAPGRVADTTSHDNDVQQQQEEEEAGTALLLNS